ncbi:protein IQ-DOMAIN 6-like [Zingiber officinale]|uniref:protein IQ-DOMAIN 6-like n=1 Tax=Zingiber officinale TaxID=94328 RepID=UPI001C4DD8D2|nr:protein IQ-DOMAIN 6-like [Zingiber officinale]
MKWNFWRSRSRRPEPVRVQVLAADASLADHSVAVRRERAALRIQTAFRSLLARRALCALKGIVRLQALVRGWLARKRAVAALECLRALLRVQARSVQALEHRNQGRRVKDAEDGWCDSRCTVESIKAKLQMRRDGAWKRERAMAYSLRNKQRRDKLKKPKLSEHPTSSSSTFIDEQELERINSCLRRLKPWEQRFMEGTEESSSVGKDAAQCKYKGAYYETFPSSSSSSFSSSSPVEQ